MRSNEVPAQTQLRANWLRSDAMVLFSELSERILPKLPDLVPTESILWVDKELNRKESVVALSQAKWMCSLLDAAYVENYFNFEKRYMKTGFSLKNHTFEQQPSNAFREGLKTVSTFPLQLMDAADRCYFRNKPPLYPDQATIIKHLRAPWFREECHVAALTRNGLWGRPSIDPDDSLYQARRDSGLLDFEYYTAGGEMRYRFSERSRQLLLLELRNTNHSYLNWLHDWRAHYKEPRPEHYNNGTSSGCPVRHHEAHYKPQAVAEPTLALDALARMFDKTPQELVARREKTGIELGLDMVADLLERAESLTVKDSAKTVAVV